MDAGSIYNKLEQEKNKLKNENLKLNSELELYKSLFNSHRNSVVYNLKIKKKNGKNVWIDRIRDSHEKILELDMDNEVKEWLKPVKCER
tara:strand:- start:165 stop:431 length:267 start_codon:yes stop_codon:yes gene_type:complete